MNTRKKGRKFEKKEEKAWIAAGFETELVRPEARFIGPGRAITGYRDFFGRYDLIVVCPKRNAVGLIQVSSSPPSSHSDPGPLGFSIPFRFGSLESPSVDQFMAHPSAGAFEIYSQYVRHGGGPYKANRSWWVRTLK